MSKDVHEVSDMVALNRLQHEIDGIFEYIEEEFGLSKNEYLVMVALWDKGPMYMKELDAYIDIKPYKRTRFYNSMVSKGWIYKERPADDERTVIIHYNEDKASDKEAIVNKACTYIKSHISDFEKHFKQVMAICEE